MRKINPFDTTHSNLPLSISESECSSWEARHKHTLPSGLKQILMKTNGGYIMDLPLLGGSLVMDVLNGLNPTANSSNAANWNELATLKMHVDFSNELHERINESELDNLFVLSLCGQSQAILLDYRQHKLDPALVSTDAINHKGFIPIFKTWDEFEHVLRR